MKISVYRRSQSSNPISALRYLCTYVLNTQAKVCAAHCIKTALLTTHRSIGLALKFLPPTFLNMSPLPVAMGHTCVYELSVMLNSSGAKFGREWGEVPVVNVTENESRTAELERE